MLRALRVRTAHARFLESCRNLREGRDYWSGVSPLNRWVLRTVLPVPLVSLLPEGKPVADALERLERDCRTRPLSVDALLDYHRVIDPAGGGAYRSGEVRMTSSTVTPPPATRVRSLMGQLGATLLDRQAAWDEERPSLDVALREAMDVYQRIGYIHPFRDGNGRVARLALNHLLRRYEHPYVVLPPLSESPALMDALQEGHRGNLNPLVCFGRLCLRRV